MARQSWDLMKGLLMCAGLDGKVTARDSRNANCTLWDVFAECVGRVSRLYTDEDLGM